MASPAWPAPITATSNRSFERLSISSPVSSLSPVTRPDRMPGPSTALPGVQVLKPRGVPAPRARNAPRCGRVSARALGERRQGEVSGEVWSRLTRSSSRARLPDRTLRAGPGLAARRQALRRVQRRPWLGGAAGGRNDPLRKRFFTTWSHLQAVVRSTTRTRGREDSGRLDMAGVAHRLLGTRRNDLMVLDTVNDACPATLSRTSAWQLRVVSSGPPKSRDRGTISSGPDCGTVPRPRLWREMRNDRSRSRREDAVKRE
jgi:hypothetical protein